MLFRELTPNLECHEIVKWRSEGGRVTVAILNYALGQQRIQLWYDRTGCAPDELTDIILEM